MALPLQAETGIKGAVCIIKADNRLVMVDEILTQRTSLPAGTIDGAETPQETAQREAWEETGLVVTVGKELARTPQAVYFDCQSDSDIIAFSQQDFNGAKSLPIWFAPHYGIETSAAKLIEPSQVDASQYRYPQEWGTVLTAFQAASNQPVQYVANLFDAAPSFHQVELGWLTALKNTIQQLPAGLASLMDVLILTGLELASPWWLLFLLPVVFAQFGRGFGFKLIFTIGVTVLMAMVAQQGVQLPAPHVYMPSLHLSEQVGFSLPNVALALWAAVVVLVWHQLGWGWNRQSALVTVFAVWLGLAQFYSGSAFLIDLLVGAVLGWLCAWHIIRVEKDPKIGFSVTQSKGTWALLVLVSGVMLMLWPTPNFMYLSATLVSLFIASRVLPSEVTMSRGHLLLTVVGLVVGYMLLGQIQSLVSSSNFHSLLVEAFRWPTLVALFTLSAVYKPSKA
ncbi:bifunctional NUDIX hydrolase/phosphatase PAP2 family protein [Vibrio intestinalis]|uniref:bifunctional NUDIX hydrolase/phosphatase PAP2 family protein n=1 Tax=Vibrio intestinalis TaxID=2933291 RepID=UPI0021A5EB72|nr:NUDIX domain-containing protein [Vibrio intestinalis]